MAVCCVLALQSTLVLGVESMIPGDPKKYSCLIKRKMNNKREIFKLKIVLDYQ